MLMAGFIGRTVCRVTVVVGVAGDWALISGELGTSVQSVVRRARRRSRRRWIASGTAAGSVVCRVWIAGYVELWIIFQLRF